MFNILSGTLVDIQYPPKNLQPVLGYSTYHQVFNILISWKDSTKIGDSARKDRGIVVDSHETGTSHDGWKRRMFRGGWSRRMPRGMAKEEFEEDIRGGCSRRMFMEEQGMWSQVFKCANGQ